MRDAEVCMYVAITSNLARTSINPNRVKNLAQAVACDRFSFVCPKR